MEFYGSWSPLVSAFLKQKCNWLESAKKFILRLSNFLLMSILADYNDTRSMYPFIRYSGIDYDIELLSTAKLQFYWKEKRCLYKLSMYLITCLIICFAILCWNSRTFLNDTPFTHNNSCTLIIADYVFKYETDNLWPCRDFQNCQDLIGLGANILANIVW